MKAAVQFVQEAYNELKKATWLSRKEATGSTIAVLIVVTLVAAYISAVDFILSVLLGAVLGR